MPMVDLIVFKATPNGIRWHVTRDDKLVNAYSLQFIAERAATRLAKVAAKRGKSARTMFYRQDGSVGVECCYGVAL
jgi:hypothetical protein